MSNRANTYALNPLLVLLVCLAGCAGNANPSPVVPTGMSSLRERGATSTATYTLTDLGTLPGCNGSEVGFARFSGRGEISSTGLAVGSSDCGATVATRFNKGQTKNLNTIGANVSFAASINDSGQITGTETMTSNGTPHAFLYNNGKMRPLDDSLFQGGTEAIQINKSGKIVGAGFITDTSLHAFLYRRGKMVDLHPFNAFQSTAASINDSGEIIGSAATSSRMIDTWLYAKGKFTVISQTNSGVFIANNGEIVGVNSANHAALYSNGTWTDLGTLPGGSTSIAEGINANGQVVGIACCVGHSRTHESVGVIFANGGAVDLNTLVSPNNGFTIRNAIAINNAGQIVGNAITTDSFKIGHAVLLTPQ
ncbi:MAG TPA: hypothetical protein VIW73_09955 [Candidatus Cybelea sp.]